MKKLLFNKPLVLFLKASYENYYSLRFYLKKTFYFYRMIKVFH